MIQMDKTKAPNNINLDDIRISGTAGVKWDAGAVLAECRSTLALHSDPERLRLALVKACNLISYLTEQEE